MRIARGSSANSSHQAILLKGGFRGRNWRSWRNRHYCREFRTICNNCIMNGDHSICANTGAIEHSPTRYRYSPSNVREYITIFQLRVQITSNFRASVFIHTYCLQCLNDPLKSHSRKQLKYRCYVQWMSTSEVTLISYTSLLIGDSRPGVLSDLCWSA